MSKDNVNKNEHGANGITSLEQMIEALKAKDYVVSSKKDIGFQIQTMEKNSSIFSF